jgi:hypothetical protein
MNPKPFRMDTFKSVLLFFALFSIPSPKVKAIHKNNFVTYYIDSKAGNDDNNGVTKETPLKSLAKLKTLSLNPGDSVLFKRGSHFLGPLIIKNSGTKNRYITLTAYGDSVQPAPAFTNPVFTSDNYGNCIRLKGSYIIVSHLYFYNTSSVPKGYLAKSFITVWEMGAVYVDKTALHCIIANNEIKNCVVGIKSYGPFTLIKGNYIHDCNRILEQWGWGPIGIWFGGDYQEACYNRIFNYWVEDPRIHWKSGKGGGADGGAFEIDDARYNKAYISIHNNYTNDCQGFLEVTEHDVKSDPVYKNFEIHHNISDDYQQFIALWDGAHCRINNNTIIRRKKNANDWGVFNIASDSSENEICNNIIVTEKDIPIFNTGLGMQRRPKSIIKNNLYYAASGVLRMGNEGPGESPVYGNPLFINYSKSRSAKDYSLRENSPAIDKGLQLGYTKDFDNKIIPNGKKPDLGAFEIQLN